MKVCGVVVEYNPMHLGHLYHLKKAKEISGSDILVAVMSGNFVQRGEFAIIDKWSRAKAAVENGIDLVLELPFVFALQSATNFGKNAVDILEKAGCDSIVFGSETNNLDELKEIASMNFKIDNFKENMKKGYSYPYTYGYMCDSYGPNDILAISYLRELNKFPHMIPYSVLRTTDYNDDIMHTDYSSALAIRTALLKNEDVSKQCLIKNIDKLNYPTWNDYYNIVRYLLLNTPINDLQQIFLMDEGIEKHLAKQAYTCYNYQDFIRQATTRRYTKSRIQRTLCHLIVHNTKEDMANLPPYDTLRVLAFSDKGKQYLKQLQRENVKIANHFTANIKQYRDIEFKAAVAYSALMSEKQKHYICRAEISGLNL
ncbi:MAG: nucleotidyltransferase family protein [Erysipelotrichia bacterium]|nr:nucleotidyltransferase family protein [Erysipelotrichia bacterium]